jgi:hypothetical protein
MKTTTLELIRSVLKTDETVPADERARIMRMLTTPGEQVKQPEPARIVSFKEAATRLARTPRTIYHYCRKGILTRAKIPGMCRANGVTGESLEAAIRGKVA